MRWMLMTLAVMLLFFACTGGVSFAEEDQDEVSGTENEDKPLSENEDFKHYDFVINSYDIYMKVNENNTMDITETLNVWFHTSKHGIYRDIPLSNKVTRLDGTTTKNHARVTDVSVNEEFTTGTEDNNFRIRIGDEHKKIKGPKEYKISYNYNLGKDPLKDVDELYFNLVGTAWKAPMENVTFTIEMPKSFDEKKLGFSAGWERSADSSNINWKVSGLTITGNYNGILKPGQALTVRLELPEGYFVGAGLENKVLDIICYSLPVLFMIIAFIIWFRFGRDDVVVDTVEFYPPDGENSLKVGFLYRGEALSSDVTSLLIYLANKGYLRIEETEERAIFRMKPTFRFVKLRDYDGHDTNEKTFMRGLFGSRDSVTVGQLYDSFYRTTNKILRNVNGKINQDRVFVRNTGWKAAVILLMIFVSAFAILIPPIYSYDHMSTLFYMIVPIIGFGFGACIILSGKGKGRKKGKMKKGRLGSFLGVVFFGFVLGYLPLKALFYPLLEENIYYMAGFIGGCICIFVMTMCFAYMPKRTPYGSQMLGRIEGFRNFLEVAEKDQLEQLVMEDPEYFYKILPYTYVLGVSDKWISKFEAIQLQAPDWYGGHYYNLNDFADRMDRTMASANRSMTSSPSESSGGGSSGGSSGGGSSGGGSGGGGGGAW